MDFYSRAAVPFFLGSLPTTGNGTDAVKRTLSDMAAIVRKYRSDATTGNVARQILTANGIRDARSQRAAVVALLQHFARDRITYVPDPVDVEQLQTPPRTLTIGTGDCDDKAILLATLLQSVGFRQVRFIAVGGSGEEWGSEDDPASEGGPPPYSHVLVQIRNGSGWLCLETIVPGAEPGWCPKGVQVLMPWHI